MWGAIIEKLEELEQHSQALDVREDGFDADDPYDLMEFADRRHRGRWGIVSNGQQHRLPAPVGGEWAAQ